MQLRTRILCQKISEPNATPTKENGIFEKSGKQNFGDQFEAAYDIVVSSWVVAKDYKVSKNNRYNFL